jgi:nucleotide-binding universal stress UspA family protein
MSADPAPWSAPRSPRVKLSRILVGADFSAPCRLALARALMLARQAGAGVDVVHVLRHPRLLTPPDEALAAVEFERFVQAQGPGAAQADVSARVVSTEGRVADALCAEAADLQAQLVVLGRAGRNLLRGLLLGSTTEKLARADDRSLLVVHPDGEAGAPYHKVLLGTDFSPESDGAVDLCVTLAPQARQVDVLHVYDRSYALVLRASAAGVDRVAAYDAERRTEAEQAMARFLARHARPGIEWMPHLIGGDPLPDVRDLAARLGAQLVVVGRRGSSGHARLGATAEGLLRVAPTDLALAGRPSFGV